MGYAGDLTPQQVWEKLVEQPNTSVLIDVRTQPEWAFVGLPALEEGMHPPLLEEWSVYPHMGINADFSANIIRRLEQAGLGQDTTLMFLCRSGVRSLAAAHAITAEGYGACYNISGGFEGDPDADGHRGSINGWKAAGLPWRQQ